MVFNFNVEMIIAISLIIIAEIIITVLVHKRYFCTYDTSVKLRQHKLKDTDCTFEQAVEEIKVVNDMCECNYGICCLCNKANL